MKLYLLKTMFLLCALVVGSMSGWAEQTDTYTFTSKSWTAKFKEGTNPIVEDSQYNWTSGKDGNGYSNGGVQVTTGVSGANATSPFSYSNISKIEVVYCTNASNGVGNIKIKVGSNTEKSFTVTKTGGTTERNAEFSFDPSESGSIKITVNCTTNSIYVKRVSITYNTGNTDPKIETTTTIDYSNIGNTDIYTNEGDNLLMASVKAGENAISDAAVTWSSNNEDVATIDEDGAVTLVAAGTTTITATYDGNDTYAGSSATYELTVTDSSPYEQPTSFDIALNNTLFGTSYSGSVSNITDSNPIVGTHNEVTVTYAGTGNHYVNDSQIRFYPSNKLKFEAPEGYEIKSISFTSSSWGITVKVGDETISSNTKTWTGKATSVEFVGSGNSGNCVLTSASIVLSAINNLPTPTVTVSGDIIIDLNGNTNVNAGTLTATVTYEGNSVTDANVTWSSSDDDIATINESTGAVTLITTGEVTFTATYAGNDNYAEATGTKTITVVDSNEPGATPENPYTVAEVINGTATGNNIYVKGFIVGEYVGNTTNPRTSGFTTDANIAIADEFSSSPTAGTSIPVQLGTTVLKNAWGCQTTSGKLLGYEVIIKGNIDTYFSVNGIKSTSEVTAISVPATISSANYATFSNSFATDFSGTGITAYTATDNGSSVKLTEIEGGQVPANTPVVLYKAGGATVNVPVIASAAEVGDNDLHVVGEGGLTGVDVYVLSKPSGYPVGFYLWDKTKTLNPGKVYLQPQTTSARQYLLFDDQTTTAIESISVKADESAAYDLQGRRVMQPTKGLYIVNGKKVVIK